jgi:NlpC/P60 family putative phage cell wall peptidase
LKGAGADCLGLVRGLWKELFGSEPERIPGYTADWSDASGEERLWEAARRHLVRCPTGTQPKPGCVILFRIRHNGVAKHLGIAAEQGGQPTFIHAYERHGVVESSLSLPWQRRIVACFEFPEGVE